MPRRGGQRWRRAGIAACCAASLFTASAGTNIHLFCWSDVRGRLRSSQLVYDPERPRSGGALALACRLEKLRERHRHVILIDGGEALRGSPDAHGPVDNPVLGVLRRIAPDVRLAGARDFNDGYDAWRTDTEALGVPVCSANLMIPGSAPAPGTVPFRVLERGGCRVAVIGLISGAVSGRLLAECMAPMRLEDEMTALERRIDEVRRRQPDILIIARRGSCRSDRFAVERLIRRFPDIDLVIGTRASQPMRGYDLDGVWIADTGGYGRWINHLVLDGGSSTGAVCGADIIEVGEFNPASCAGMESFTASCAAVDARLNETVAVLPGGEECFSDAALRMARAIARGAGADVALQNTPSRRSGFSGIVTERDVWEMAPYDDRAVYFHATAAELLSMVNDAAQRGFPLALCGLDTLKDDGRVIELRTVDGRPPHPRKRFDVVVSSYLAASADGRCPLLAEIMRRPECRMHVSTNRVRDCFRRGLQQAVSRGHFMRDGLD